MRAVIQRVTEASVTFVPDTQDTVRKIKSGMVVLLGIETGDTGEDIAWLSRKIVQMRIFGDEKGLMNLSIKDTGGDILLISQFTLHAATHKGNRPSFLRAAGPDKAIALYNSLCAQMEQDLGKPITKGIFGTHMQIALVNDGPVTIIIDSKSEL